MNNPVSVGDDLVAKLNGWAVEIDNDGTPSQIGPTSDELREAASQLAAVTAANNALIAERTSIIATKREQIASLMDERNNLADIVNSGIDDVAGAKLDELEERATTAEAQLKAAREALEDLKEGKVDSLGDFIALADAALNPKAPS